MSLLSACQNAAIELISKKPSTIFSATDAFSLELQRLSNVVARDIADSHDWQTLISTYTINGDGVTSAFPLPDNYDRMLLDTNLYDKVNWAWGYFRIVRADEWMLMKVRDWGLVNPGAWTVLGGNLEFLPAPQNTAQAQFLYVKNERVLDKDGNPKKTFTKDDDSFVLDEDLLTLGIIWRWREMKRMDATNDLANFEKMFSTLSGKDGGSKVIRTPARWMPWQGRFAYPWPLGS